MAIQSLVCVLSTNKTNEYDQCNIGIPLNSVTHNAGTTVKKAFLRYPETLPTAICLLDSKKIKQEGLYLKLSLSFFSNESAWTCEDAKGYFLPTQKMFLFNSDHRPHYLKNGFYSSCCKGLKIL